MGENKGAWMLLMGTAKLHFLYLPVFIQHLCRSLVYTDLPVFLSVSKEHHPILRNRLISFVCELYLDDILVSGKTKDEFILNLRTVFVRLDKHYLKLRAPKCLFGFKELEWVGKVISSEGFVGDRGGDGGTEDTVG